MSRWVMLLQRSPGKVDAWRIGDAVGEVTKENSYETANVVMVWNHVSHATEAVY